MEENKEMLELLKQIEKANRQQARMTKIVCILALVSAVCFGATLLLVWDLLPQIEAILPQVDGVITQMQTVLGNLEQTTQQLAAVDFGSMVSNVDALVSTGQESLQQTMEKLNSIDFDALNKAVEDLTAVVEPLSKFANMFR